MMIKCYDKREVRFASSLYDDSMRCVLVRGGSTEKPEVVLNYNSNMKGVNLADGHLHFYFFALNRLKNTT
mgnify:CR=1 FL=1